MPTVAPQRLRALIVEDSPDDVFVLIQVLRRNGFEPVVERVETAEEMSAALDASPWDVVIADYHLPRFSAPRALALLRDKGLDIPCIVISGQVGEEMAVATMKAGAHDYVMKQNLQRLVPAITRELAEAEQRRQKREAQAALHESDARYRSLVENAYDMVLSIGLPEGRFLFVNGAGRRTLGYDAEQIESLTLREVIHPLAQPTWEKVLQTIHAGRPVEHVELTFITADGRPIEVEGNLHQYLVGGKAVACQGMFRDINDRKVHAALLQHQATHDALTNLPNRHYLYSEMQRALESTAANARPQALLMIDLDRFKEINDTLGHLAGDEALREIGQRLRQQLGARGLLARLGGDEFAVYLSDPQHAREVTKISSELLHALDQPLALAGMNLEIGASIGIALCPDHGAEVGTLLRCADVAMYAAKRKGSGWMLYDAVTDEHNLRRLAVMTELGQALRQSQLILHYQPKIDLRDARLVGVEALVRWLHPRHGLVMPSQFVPLAETGELVRPLFLWVLDQALRQCQAWRISGLGTHVAVNISARNLQDNSLPDEVARLLETRGVEAGHLELEITESAVMHDPDRSLITLQRLHDMGVVLSLDDFGTGHSSLAYLKKLPVRNLKIDASFIIGMTHEKHNAMIVQAMIQLAHNLGLKVIAEGVEDESVLTLLRGWGCDEAQGYHLGVPDTAAATTDRLSRQRMATT